VRLLPLAGEADVQKREEAPADEVLVPFPFGTVWKNAAGRSI